MKLLKVMFLTCVATTCCFGQGTVDFMNLSTCLVSTNASGIGGGSGPTAPTLGQFRYALFTASSTVTAASLPDLLSGTWTLTGIYAGSIPAITGGRFSGGMGAVTLTGWLPGQTNSYTIAGWSTGLGQDWSDVVNELRGATFKGGLWAGADLSSSQGLQFFGLSGVGFLEAGGGTPQPMPPPLLFASGPTGQGTPLMTGFNLYPLDLSSQQITVPEPCACGLLVAGMTLLVVRRQTALQPRSE